VSVFFPEAERQVYCCPVTNRKYDPLAVKRAISAASKSRFNDMCADARSEDEAKALAAQGQIVAVARAALGLKPIDPETGEGVLDADAYDALVQFTRWLRGKGGRAPETRSSSPCTGCQ
jgi:uncharacterized protein (DUF169 family)